MRLTAFSRVSKDQHGLRAPSLLSASTLISMILVCAAPYRAVPHSWFAIWFANFGLLLSLLHYIEAVSRNSKQVDGLVAIASPGQTPRLFLEERRPARAW
jgi:hypothetical protein